MVHGTKNANIFNEIRSTKLKFFKDFIENF